MSRCATFSHPRDLRHAGAVKPELFAYVLVDLRNAQVRGGVALQYLHLHNVRTDPAIVKHTVLVKEVHDISALLSEVFLDLFNQPLLYLAHAVLNDSATRVLFCTLLISTTLTTGWKLIARSSATLRSALSSETDGLAMYPTVPPMA